MALTEGSEITLARELLKKHYNEPVLPISQVCEGLNQWMGLIRQTHEKGPQEWRQGEKYYALLPAIWIDVRKSCLLDRILYCGEKPSQTPCPVHQGRWSGCHWGWPGSISVALSDHDGYKAGDAFPGAVQGRQQEWYDAGCRCAYHMCGCTTGWLPDEHCGCGGEEGMRKRWMEKYGDRLVK